MVYVQPRRIARQEPERPIQTIQCIRRRVYDRLMKETSIVSVARGTCTLSAPRKTLHRFTTQSSYLASTRSLTTASSQSSKIVRQFNASFRSTYIEIMHRERGATHVSPTLGKRIKIHWAGAQQSGVLKGYIAYSSRLATLLKLLSAAACDT